MPRGLAWIDPDGKGSGYVIVLLDDGRENRMPAALYAVKNLHPPLYNLQKSKPEIVKNNGSVPQAGKDQSR